MSHLECILCKGTTINQLCDISVSDLSKIYTAWLSHDISSEFDGLKSLSYVECSHCGLRFFSPLITGSNRFYDLLIKTMGDHYYQNDKMEYQFASRFINDTDVVLDVGSGRGVFSKYIKGNYIGLDCNPTALEQARPGGIKVVNDSIEDHVHKIATLYSVVTAFQVIEHVAEPGKFIQFCLEALRPGGLLIVSVPSEESFVSLQENAVLNMPPHHVSRWSDGSLLSLGKLFNLTLIALEHEKLAGIHYEPYISLLSNITIRTLLKWDKGDMIDISLKKRIVDILSRFLKPLYRNVFRNNSLWPTGHSVTVIFRKQVSDETSQW